MKGFERAAELAGNLGQDFHLALDAMSSGVAFFFPSDSELFVSSISCRSSPFHHDDLRSSRQQ